MRNSFNDNEPDGWLFKLVPYFIAFVFLLIVAGAIGYGIVIYKALTAVGNCNPALVQNQIHGQTTWSLGCKK
jgi:hypothetical protein